jgi:type I restriction enzyme, S subunit
MSGLPDDWYETTVGESAKFLTGFPFSSSRFSSTGVKLIRGSNVKRNVIDWSPDIARYWPNEDLSLRSYQLSEGDIVIAMDGALVGRSYALISKEDLPAYLVQRVARLRGTSLDQGLLFAWIASDRFVNHVDSVKTHTAIPHISPRDIRDFPIIAPVSRMEQKRLATALADAANLMAALERLIGKKQAIKLGIMQQLLTGKTRLPGFSAEWGQTRLGDHFDITSSKRVFQREWRSAGVPFYRARELAVLSETGTVNNDLFIDRRLFHKYKRLHGAPSAGDFLVTAVGTLGKTYVVQPTDEFYFKDGNIIWLKASATIDSMFLKLLFETPFVQEQVHGESSGTTVGTYTITNAKRTVIPFPELEEQRAIAAVLESVDVDLRALLKFLAKMKAVKQGMMQELLTGRTRLAVVEALA